MTQENKMAAYPTAHGAAGGVETASVQILFVTDPICSHCWAMEPAWRRFLYLYGEHVEVSHLYGGLLPHWEGFADVGAGIRAPADIPPHWDEVVERYGQPIDASVWLTDPLASSYPPSVAVHAVRALAPEREEAYLRRIRQALFLEARNIARREVLIDCAADIGLDPDRFAAALDDPASEAGFAADLAAKVRSGIRVRIPADVVHGFRPKASTGSGVSRPRNPEQGVHRFRACRPRIPVEAVHSRTGERSDAG
jgi:predicted DsbA family dithiol-disulfide isomerase